MAATTVTEFNPTEMTPQQMWLENRRRFVGGSDAGSLFPEESRYGCDTRLFFDKTGKKPDYPRTQREDDILKRGHVWEAVVANYFAEETGLKIRRIGSRVSKEHPAMGVNMDRQIVGVTTEQIKALWPDCAALQKLEGECGPGYLECKTTNEFMFKQMMAEGITVDYLFQINHGLAVTGYKWGVFAVLEPTWGQFATFPVVFMDALGAEQIKRAEAFWEALENGVMPQPKVNDKRCKTCIFRRSCPRSQQLMAEADKEWTAEGYIEDDSLSELVSDYREALAIAEEKDQTVEAIKERIKERMGDRGKVEVPSCGVRINWSFTKPPQRWDSKALEGTVKDISRFDIPDNATCQKVTDVVGEEIKSCGKPAVAVIDAARPALLLYVCEVCAIRMEKAGCQIVARKGVPTLVASCRRAGEPSRPFKFSTI